MADEKPKPPRPVVPPPTIGAKPARPVVPPQAKPAPEAQAGGPAAPKPAAPAAAGDKPSAASSKAAAETVPADIGSHRAMILAVLEEKKLLGESVTIGLDTKEVTFTGRIIRIVPGEGFTVLENVDGRRRGLWYILGGTLKTGDGREFKLPMDGLAR